MKVRVGLLRGLILALGVLLLVVPVGVDTPKGPMSASVGEVLGELASGHLGVGILSGLVAGGALATAAAWRIVLAGLAAVAWWLSGGIRVVRDEGAPAGRMRCPHCRGWVSRTASACPHCGRSVDGG